MSQPFQGKVAIITGASRGIGKAIALKLADMGINIAVGAKTTRNENSAPGTIFETAESVEKKGAMALPVKTDVRFEDQIQNLVSRTVEAFGRIDYIINNAGAIIWKPVEELPVRHFDRMWQINIRASFILCHYAIPYLKKNSGSYIINLSPPPLLGPLAVEQWAGRTGYLITKFAMSHLTEGLAEELKSFNVGVSSLWPENIIDTQATRVFASMFRADAAISWYSSELMADAVLEILKEPDRNYSGQTLIAEKILQTRPGFSLEKYRVPCPV